MIYEIELIRIALKSMAKIPKKELNRIQSRLEALSLHPRPEGLKKIRGNDNLCRSCYGNY
ncbi:hypothetical protein NEOC84_001817|nr:hypothetical protein [Neochlamydia sp. AcF84]